SQAHTAVVIAVPGGQVAYGPLMLVTLDGGGVDHEVGLVQGLLTIGCTCEAQVGAQFAGVARGQLMDHLQPLLVDVHEADLTAGQALGQAQIFDQSKRELRASGADDAYSDCGCHSLSSPGYVKRET